MIVIKMTFPAGRYHTTPWGRQVNEGSTEWPPSPWRLLRALLATWHHKFPEIDEPPVRQLVETLTAPPSYSLPLHVAEAHTRHYMPAQGGKTTKIFDAFAALPKDAPLYAIWPNIALSSEQASLLDALLRSMNYFGRGESWVEAGVETHASPTPNAVPMNSAHDASTSEIVRLLAAVDPVEHVLWRHKALQRESQRRLHEKIAATRAKGKPTDGVKLSKADLAKLDEQFPPTVFDALHVNTADLRSAGWNYPPGSRWIEYVRPRDAFTRIHRTLTKRESESSIRPTVARFAVSSTVRPLLTEALWIGERTRASLMSRSCNGSERVSPVFSGKQHDGLRLDNGHQHAHYFCEANGRDGRITHLTVFAPMGFNANDEHSLASLRKLWGRDEHDLQLVLLGIGRPSDFAPNLVQRLNPTAGHSPIMARARKWISRTPFVPPRFLKARAGNVADQLITQVRLELSRREWQRPFADDVLIEPLLDNDRNGTWFGGHFTRWLKFRRQRQKGGGQRAGSLGYGFRLTFPEAVRGPIALGYGSHFGLGLFVPDTENDHSESVSLD